MLRVIQQAARVRPAALSTPLRSCSQRLISHYTYRSTVSASSGFSSPALSNSCSHPALGLASVRFYSHGPELTREIIETRITELLEGYSKVKLPEGKGISLDSSFTKDLGLDSFDIVEVLMEIEYEFSIVIPDHDADDIKTVGQAVDYIAKQPDAC